MKARSRPVRIPVTCKLNGSNGGTVTITPDGLVQVRPLHQRRTFDMPLSSLAELIVQRVIMAEFREANPVREKKRRVRRGLLS